MRFEAAFPDGGSFPCTRLLHGVNTFWVDHSSFARLTPGRWRWAVCVRVAAWQGREHCWAMLSVLRCLRQLEGVQRAGLHLARGVFPHRAAPTNPCCELDWNCEACAKQPGCFQAQL
jgi:hypothetical protein